MKKITKLEGRYQFREPYTARAFLLAHPEMIDLAFQASVKIPEFLPADEGLVLEVTRDPEDVDDHEELFAIVPTRADYREIERLLERLLREWLIDAGRPVGLLFNVGVEYR